MPITIDLQPGGTGLCTMTYGEYSFVPVPLISVSREIVRESSGTQIFLRQTLNCSGTLVLLTQPKTFGSLDTSQYRALVSALSRDNERLTIYHENGSFITNVYPRVENFSTEEGVWVDKIRYTFSFVWEEALATETGVESFSDDWSWSEEEDGKYTLTHSISAKGRRFLADYGNYELSNLVENAKDFCIPRSGLDNIPSVISATLLNLTGNRWTRTAYSQAINLYDGSFSIQENFSSNYDNQDYLAVRSIQINVNETREVTITINCSVRGVGTALLARKTSAEAGLILELGSAFSRCNTVYLRDFPDSDRTLNTNYTSRSITTAESTGNAEFSITFTDSDSSNVVKSDYRITHKKPVSQFAIIPIPGKIDGPVIQNLGTTSQGQYTISGSVTGITMDDAIAAANDIISENSGSSFGSTAKITEWNVDKSPKSKSLTFTVTWSYNGTGASETIS